MQIFFVNKFNWLDASPMATVSTMITYNLARHGVKTTLIIGGDPALDSNEILKEKFGLEPLPKYRVKLIDRKIKGMTLSAKLYMGARREILIQLSDDDNTIVISRNTNFLPYLYRLGKRRGVKAIFETHGYHGETSIDGLPATPRQGLAQKLSSYRQYERLFLNKLDGVVCTIEPQQKLYIADFLKTPSVVLPHGAKPLDKNVKPIEPDKAFKFKNFVYTGRLTTHIDVASMINCLKLTKNKEIKITWLGLKPDNIEYLKPKVETAGLSDRFLLRGWVTHKEMIDYISNEVTAGLAIYRNTFRSAAVTCPTKIFDYFSVGLPVVATDIASVASVMKSGTEGLLYEPDSAASLAASLDKICSDMDNYKKLHEGSQKAAEYYSWENKARRLLDFIATL